MCELLNSTLNRGKRGTHVVGQLQSFEPWRAGPVRWIPWEKRYFPPPCESFWEHEQCPGLQRSPKRFASHTSVRGDRKWVHSKPLLQITPAQGLSTWASIALYPGRSGSVRFVAVLNNGPTWWLTRYYHCGGGYHICNELFPDPTASQGRKSEIKIVSYLIK